MMISSWRWLNVKIGWWYEEKTTQNNNGFHVHHLMMMLHEAKECGAGKDEVKRREKILTSALEKASKEEMPKSQWEMRRVAKRPFIISSAHPLLIFSGHTIIHLMPFPPHDIPKIFGWWWRRIIHFSLLQQSFGIKCLLKILVLISPFLFRVNP